MHIRTLYTVASELAHLFVSSSLSAALSITSMVIGLASGTSRIDDCSAVDQIRCGRSSAVTIAAQDANAIALTTSLKEGIRLIALSSVRASVPTLKQLQGGPIKTAHF